MHVHWLPGLLPSGQAEPGWGAGKGKRADKVPLGGLKMLLERLRVKKKVFFLVLLFVCFSVSAPIRAKQPKCHPAHCQGSTVLPAPGTVPGTRTVRGAAGGDDRASLSHQGHHRGHGSGRTADPAGATEAFRPESVMI